MARFGGAVRGDQVVAQRRAQTLRQQGRGAGDEAVQHHGAAPGGRAQHDAGQHAELEASHLGQYADRVVRVGRVDLQRPLH